MARQYIVSVVGNGFSETFRPSVATIFDDLPIREAISWSALDLRTLDEQKVNTGQMLVTFDEEIGPTLHAAVMAVPGTSLFTKNDTKESITSRIGTEADNERFDPGMAEEYCKRIHRKRRQRYVNERVKAVRS